MSSSPQLGVSSSGIESSSGRAGVTWLRQEVTVPVVVAAGHMVPGLLGLVDIGTAFALGCANSFAVWRWLQLRRGGGRQPLAFVTGYFVLFVLFGAIAHSPLLFVAFGMLYTGCFRVPLLIGYLAIAVMALALATPYWLQTTLICGLLLTMVAPLLGRPNIGFQLLCLGFGFLLVAAILLPLLYLCFQVTPQTLLTNVSDATFRSALATSVVTATVSTLTVLIFGVPLAYAIARLQFPGRDLLDALIDLPIVIPQSVVGIAILVLLGPKTPIGQGLKAATGIDVAGTRLGIILCQIFVSSPFLIRSAANAFRDMGPAIENVSRTLGASPWSTFRRVSLPLASGGIFAGCILTWARAISEVGSLMILAYHPFTVSVYTFDTFVQYGLQEARPAAVLLVIVCLWGFLVLRWMRTLTASSLLTRGRRTSR